MSQVRGICGHLKGKYVSHLSCLNCSGCSRFNCCVECHSWADSIWDLADKSRSFRGRQMGKKKESREKQQKGFRSKRSSKTASQDDPAGSSVISLMTPLRGNLHPLCLSHHRGVISDSGTARFPVNDHMEQRVRRLTRAAGRPTLPPHQIPPWGSGW